MKNVKENIMRFVFILAACVSIAAVALICIFLQTGFRQLQKSAH